MPKSLYAFPSKGTILLPEKNEQMTYNKVSNLIFHKIQMAMGDVKDLNPFEKAYDVVKLGAQVPEIRDEIYLQVIDQK